MQPTSLFYFDHNTAHSLFFSSFVLSFSLVLCEYLSCLDAPLKWTQSSFVCLWFFEYHKTLCLFLLFSVLHTQTHTQKLSLTTLRILVGFHIFVLLLFVKRVVISSCILQQCSSLIRPFGYSKAAFTRRTKPEQYIIMQS